MKKLIILFVVLMPMIILSQVLPFASNLGFKSTQHYDQPSGNRSIPPGLLVWSQPPVCTDALWACQQDVVTPFDAKVVDDFMFPSTPGQITAVRWWIGWWNPNQYTAPTSFNIIIFNDNSCLPGTIVSSWNIPFANANEDAGCIPSYPSREYWATLTPPFNPIAGQHYWICTQPVITFPPQTGIPPAATQNLCPAMQDFPYIGLPMTDINGTYDTAFELYAGGPAPTPISNWVFLLSGLLIAGAIFFRYRRSS